MRGDVGDVLRPPGARKRELWLVAAGRLGPTACAARALDVSE